MAQGTALDRGQRNIGALRLRLGALQHAGAQLHLLSGRPGVRDPVPRQHDHHAVPRLVVA